MIDRPMTILVLGSDRWSVPWWRPPLFKALAVRGVGVVYLNLPRFGIRRLREKRTSIDPSGVQVIQPQTLWPYKYGRWMSRRLSTGDWAMVPQAEIDFVWASHPEETWIWHRFPSARRIYDVYDYYQSDQNREWTPQQHELLDSHTARVADIVVTVSEPLGALYRPLAKRVLILPNACPLLDPRPSDTLLYPAERRAGLVVKSFSRVDWEYVRQWADINYDWTLEIVGPGSPRGKARNMRWLGYLAGNHLRSRASSWSIGLLPYTGTKFNYYCSPLKLFEYIAWGAYVVVANDKVALVNQYARVYPELIVVNASPQRVSPIPGGLTRQRARENFLAAETWTNRADILLEAMSQSLSRDPSC